jgi:DNA helicase-2/ATP-dependent DNA helicase PcrA
MVCPYKFCILHSQFLIPHPMNHQDARNMLNQNQRQAVETLEGPVLTIAGPGTGKTQVLALRIVEILKTQPDISAGNILCLTYTNAGVIAMRKRLLEFIGPEAHKVQIHTYHSFCNQVIQENIEHFDIREAENISELEQYELCEQILDDLPADHLFFHKSSYHHIKDLLGLFSTLKSEGWNEAIIKENVAEYLKEIPDRPEFQYKRKYKEFNAGDPNPKKIAEEEERMKKLVMGAELFTKYQKMMTESGLYDFQDMILWVIKKFEQDERMLALYQERYQYILVDEFQDTNGSQKKILDLLCNFWNDPNVFVVGDDDQSIFRFQGANMRNIMEFIEQYQKSVQIITIDQNYRSSQKILDIAEHIIQKNSERLVTEIPNASKHLTAQNPKYKDCPESPTLIEYENPYHQEYGILNELKALQKNGEDLSEGAVIYQNHSQAENLIKACEKEGIPIQVKEMQNILDTPIIQQVLELLEYFAEEAKNPLSREDILFRSLYFSVFAISHADIIRLTLWRRADPKNRFFKLAITDPEVLGAIEGINNPKKLLTMGEIFSGLEEDFHNIPFLRFFENLLEKSGFLHFALNHEEKSFLLRCLSTLFRMAKEDARKKPGLSAEGFLTKIRRIKTHGLNIPIEKSHSEKNGVHFLTAHSAKGLEFERVYLLGVEKRVWDQKQRNGGFSFPDTLTLSNEGDFLEEKTAALFCGAYSRQTVFASELLPHK